VEVGLDQNAGLIQEGRSKSGLRRTGPLRKTGPKFKEKRIWAKELFFEFIQGF
jgi:hypothetical protein